MGLKKYIFLYDQDHHAHG